MKANDRKDVVLDRLNMKCNMLSMPIVNLEEVSRRMVYMKLFTRWSLTFCCCFLVVSKKLEKALVRQTRPQFHSNLGSEETDPQMKMEHTTRKSESVRSRTGTLPFWLRHLPNTFGDLSHKKEQILISIFVALHRRRHSSSSLQIWTKHLQMTVNDL